MSDTFSEGDLLLVAKIAGRTIAVPAGEVASISELEKITAVPGAPDWIEGIGTQRSHALTVLDARRAIGLDPTGDDALGDVRCIVFKEAEHLYALRCDEVLDVTAAQSGIGALPKGLGLAWMAVATGVVETALGLSLVIDLAALIAGPDRLAA